jgi:hypothetical protein
MAILAATLTAKATHNISFAKVGLTDAAHQLREF